MSVDENKNRDNNPDPKESLAEAKAAFRTSVLQNDTVFSLLQAQLLDQNEPDKLLPEFGIEPTLVRNEDGTSLIGFRIKRSLSSTEANGAISIGFGLYDYFPIGVLDRSTGDLKLSPELEAGLEAVGKEKSDGLRVAQAWQTGCAEMGAHFTDPVMIDPHSGTFELESVVMSRSYAPESPTS